MTLPSTDPSSLSGSRLLVLDDDYSVRRLVQSALRRWGCEVETASNGREGLQIMLRKDFDVLVVDIRMTGMDGLAFIQEARKIWPWLGIVIITGYADEAIRQRAADLMVNRILEKPLVLEDLRHNILDEFRDKLARIEALPKLPLDKIRYQLGILRHLVETAIGGGNLAEALRLLGQGLAGFLPSDIIGLLAIEGEDRLIMLNAQRPLTSSVYQDVRDDMTFRYEALTGQPLHPESTRIEHEGPPMAGGESGEMRVLSTFSVPILSGDTLHGMITLASTSADAYSAADITFLYHAANQFSAVLFALGRMKELAVRDSLTGLYNKRQWNTEFKQAWDLSVRYDNPVSVVVIDIDHFKELNDEHGHLVGDQLLREFAGLLDKVARASDIPGRFGGDEFVVLLPQTETADARAFGERFSHAVRNSIFCSPGTNLRITCSVGVANSRNAAHPKNPEALLEQADQALYVSKRAGRNRMTVWSPSIASLEPHDQEDRTSTVDQAEPSARPLRGHILIVDDESSICRLVKRMLEREMYSVDYETTAKAALQRIAGGRKYNLALIDLQLADESGLDLLQEVHAIDSNLIKIIISGHATVDNAIASLRFGAYDFIEKPIIREQLIAVIERALDFHRLTIENERYQLYLEEMVQQKNTALTKAYDEIRRSYDFTLEAMVRMLDAREKATGQHSVRVREFALTLARAMDLQSAELDDIARGALLHDIGKISIPDAILLKAGPLDDDEWKVMKSHVQTGYDLIKSSDYLATSADIVLSHHEKFDGSGYPRGLRGSDICLGARIFAVVDAYDAMRSERVYRSAMSLDSVVQEIRRCSGTHFDPEVVEIFTKCLPELERIGAWEQASKEK